MKLKNIPNILSIIRICLVFVFVALVFTAHVYWAILVFLIAGATDVLDGYLARRNQWISNLGKVLDPLADKMMQLTALVCLCIKGYIPLWFVIPFFAKEIFMLLAGAIVIKRRSFVVVSKWYGKLTVCLFYGTVVLSVILRNFFAEHALLGILAFIPAMALALFSLVSYIKQYAWLKNAEPKRGNILKSQKED